MKWVLQFLIIKKKKIGTWCHPIIFISENLEFPQTQMILSAPLNNSLSDSNQRDLIRHVHYVFLSLAVKTRQQVQRLLHILSFSLQWRLQCKPQMKQPTKSMSTEKSVEKCTFVLVSTEIQKSNHLCFTIDYCSIKLCKILEVITAWIIAFWGCGMHSQYQRCYLSHVKIDMTWLCHKYSWQHWINLRSAAECYVIV